MGEEVQFTIHFHGGPRDDTTTTAAASELSDTTWPGYTFSHSMTERWGGGVHYTWVLPTQKTS